jgi:hypothetical protein
MLLFKVSGSILSCVNLGSFLKKMMFLIMISSLHDWMETTVDGRVKLSTDGACNHGHAAGCGGIVRDSRGRWCGGFAKFVSGCSASVVELWGVCEGLKYTIDVGISRC